MLSIEALKRALSTIKDLGDQAAKLSASVASKVDAIEKDGSRSASWKAEQVAAIRQAGIDAMSELWQELRARYEELGSERVYWDSPMFALSQYGLQGFTKGSPEEMTVRGQVLTEFRMLPPGMLKLEAQGAASNRDWARLYLALLALEEKQVNPPVNLGTLPIGNLTDAQEVFFEAEMAYRGAEVDLTSTRGQVRSNQAISIGLLQMRQEELRRARAAGLVLNWDERKAMAEEDPTVDPVIANLGRRG
jgi:hypothetical protein